MGVDRSGLLVAASALNDHAAGLRRAADRLGAAGSEARQAEIGIAASWVSPESDAFRGRLRVVSDALSAAVPAPGESSAASMRLSGTAEQIAGILGSLDQEFAALESELRALTSQPIGPCDPPPDTSAVEHRMRSNRERRRAVESEWATECARTRAEFDRATEAVDRARARLHSDAPTEVRATGVMDPVSGPMPIHPLPVPSFEEIVLWLLHQADLIAKAYMELWKRLGLWVRTVSPGVNLLIKVLAVVANVLIAWEGIKELFGGAWKDPDAALIDRLASGLLIVAGGLAIAALVLFSLPVSATLSAAAGIVWAIGKAIKHRDVVLAWTRAIWSTAKAVAGVVWELLKDQWQPHDPIVPLAEEAWNWVKDKAGQVWDWTSDVWKSRWDLAREAWDRFLRFIDRGAALILSTAKALLVIALFSLLAPLLAKIVAVGAVLLLVAVVLVVGSLVVDIVMKPFVVPTSPQTANDYGADLNSLLRDLPLHERELAELAVRLSEMSPDQVREYVRDWTQEQWDPLINRYPDIIGLLDGAPALVRARANADRVERDRAAAEKAGDKALARKLEQLQKAAALVGEGGLYTYRSDHPDRYILVVGDPDKACDVTVFVPGTGSNAKQSPKYAEHAANINAHTLVRAQTAGVTDCGYATFIYNDYDTPGWLPTQLPTDALAAEHAAPELAGFLDNVFSANTTGTVTLLAHSYGGTVLGAALNVEVQLPMERVTAVMFWSTPGIGVDQIDDLYLVDGGVPPVYALTNPKDPIRRTPSSLLGPQPDTMVGVIVPEQQFEEFFNPLTNHLVEQNLDYVLPHLTGIRVGVPAGTTNA
jgi:hypothetical protein